MTYPESHSREPSCSHFRAVPRRHSKHLRAGHLELTLVCCQRPALAPSAPSPRQHAMAVPRLRKVCLRPVQAQTPSQSSQPPLTTPGCATMTLPGVSQGLTVSLKAGAQNGAGLRGALRLSRSRKQPQHQAHEPLHKCLCHLFFSCETFVDRKSPGRCFLNRFQEKRQMLPSRLTQLAVF